MSTIRCSPVKKGWQLEQISTLNSGLVAPVVNWAPQEQVTVALAKYSGCISVFIIYPDAGYTLACFLPPAKSSYLTLPSTRAKRV